MNTRGENVTEMMRDAEQSERRERTRRADLEWAQAWYCGSARCPNCGRTEFGLVDLDADARERYESMSCTHCGTRWKVEFRESAVVVLREETDCDDEWIELSIDALHFSEREAATILAALRYWRREGPSSAGHERDIATGFDRLRALSAEEIDGLCERIGESHNVRT